MKTIKWIALTFSVVLFLDIFFDLGKWALGRYTGASPLLSVLVIVGFSALLACSVEGIHAIRRRAQKRYEQYLHHKTKVWVAKDQKGRHWHSSLCPYCEFFSPDTSMNCLMESLVHVTSRDNHLTLVIWECPKFKRSRKRNPEGLKIVHR